MAKVVLNKCYGGFGLSDEAMNRYCELIGNGAKKEKVEWSDRHFIWKTPDGNIVGEWLIERDDPSLVQVVEELGEKANGSCSELVVEDIPKGTRYRIGEYDGKEWVETQDDIDWRVG